MNNKPAPLISIILSVLDGKATLQQCIDSVTRQTYPNKELIVIDGGSKDGTVNLLTANQGKIVYWISEPDCGIYNAWNKGLAQAKGEWICFLGADDFFWDTQVLERMAGQLEKIPSSVLVAYGQIMRLTVEGQELFSVGKPWQDIREDFKQFMSIPHPAVMHRRCLFERHGKFDESFHIAGDYELLFRELKTGDAVFIPGIITTGVRFGGISTLSGNTITALLEIARVQRMHGQLFPGFFLLKEMGKEYFRLLLRKVLGEQSIRKLRDLCKRIKNN